MRTGTNRSEIEICFPFIWAYASKFSRTSHSVIFINSKHLTSQIHEEGEYIEKIKTSENYTTSSIHYIPSTVEADVLQTDLTEIERVVNYRKIPYTLRISETKNN